MEVSVPPILLYGASWVTITGGVWALFERAETVASDQAKSAVSQWLMNLNPGGTVANLPTTFASTFDSVFGKKHFSLRCFGMSCLASFISVLIVYLIFCSLMLIPPAFYSLPWYQLTFAISLLSIANFLPDYVSLLESRFIIRLMSAKPTLVRVLSLLALDILATSLIFYFASVIVLLVARSAHPAFVKVTIIQILEICLLLFPNSITLSRLTPYSILLYSTFFTSVWIWLYIISNLIVKVCGYFGLGINKLRTIIDIETKPLRSIGMISNLLITVLYLVLPFLI